jgi:geranylgeranyl diphosphate synthase type I
LAGYSSKADRELMEMTAEYRMAIEEALGQLRPGTSLVARAAVESLRSGGKRLRGSLALLCCEALCGDYRRALPVAVLCELAHSASLIQDDIIDEAAVRHRQPTVQRRYGLMLAMLASDLLIFEMFGQLVGYRRLPVSKGRVLSVLEQISLAAKLTLEGEFMELSLTGRGSISEQEYMEVASLKTGALFAGACASGAIVGGASKKVVRAMQDFGRNLGIAFQIRDDVLDIVGEPEETGKALLKDLQNNALNIVIVHALARADAYTRQAINSFVWKQWYTPEEIRSVQALLRGLGSFDYAEEVSQACLSACRRSLQLLPSSEPRAKLERLIALLEHRRR